MANRYWVINTGDWSDTAHWSATSGGIGGVSIPTSTDNVYFDANSFTVAGQAVTINTSAYCLDFDWTGALHNPTLKGSATIAIWGSLKYASTMSDISTGTKYMRGTGCTINTNGVVLNSNIQIGGEYGLAGEIVLNGGCWVEVAFGSFNTNNFNITLGRFINTGTLERTIILGSSIITCSGAWEFTSAGTTFNVGTSTIKMTGNTAYFKGGGFTYNNVELQGDLINVTYSNTFNDLKLTAGKTINFQSDKIQTITSLSGDGTSASLITIQSTVAGSPYTISKASGIETVSYYSIKDCIAIGGATFKAIGSINVSGNSGWVFVITTSASITCIATVTCIAYTRTYSVLANGLTTDKGSFFKFGDKLHYLQAGKYLQYDGTTVSEVVPYIPTVIINRTPTGGGDVLENYNRIGKGFTNKFNGDAAAVAYTLTDSGLDTTTVICTVGGVAKVENTDFTVNRTIGIVTFTGAPATGTNNVIITAYKTIQADIDTILNCKYAIPFGGQNDNRLFIGGNGTGYFYWTGISANGIDATYFAYNNYNVIGNSDEDITGFGKHYDTLTIHKESGEIFGETYTFDGTKGIFNTFPINQQYGCDCPDTLQNINNNLVWLNSRYGVCILVGTTVGSQRNAFPISRNINPRLMKETNLKTASSVDSNGHYLLCVNDKVYGWNYFISPYYDTGNPDENARRLSWWYWDNINALNFISDGQDLYYADRSIGQIVKFVDNFVDFDSGIDAIYRIPLRDFGNSVYEFDVISMWVDVRSDTRTEVQIAYVISDESSLETELDEISVGSFSIPGFSIPTFTLNVMGFRQTFVFQPLEKKIDLFGIEFTNSAIGRDMNISNVVISYKLGKRKR